MSKEKPISQRLIEKQKELIGLGNVVALHAASRKLPPEAKQEADNEQFRLEFRLNQLEEQGLDLKIATYNKVINILKIKGVKTV